LQREARAWTIALSIGESVSDSLYGRLVMPSTEG
jgi:hypothetical protein